MRDPKASTIYNTVIKLLLINASKIQEILWRGNDTVVWSYGVSELERQARGVCDGHIHVFLSIFIFSLFLLFLPYPATDIGVATRFHFSNSPTFALVSTRISLTEGLESRTGRALENAYKHCPSGNVTRQSSILEN